jgi:hypothetical protein
VYGEIGDVCEVVEVAVVVEDGAVLADAYGGDEAVECAADGLALAAGVPVQRGGVAEVVERVQAQDVERCESRIDATDGVRRGGLGGSRRE